MASNAVVQQQQQSSEPVAPQVHKPDIQPKITNSDITSNNISINNQPPPPPPPPPVANIENQFFYEDEVFYLDRKGNVKFGLVMENYEAASSDNEDDFEDILRKGEIRVAWHPDGKEEIINENNVGLADRTLMPGDVVRRLIPGKDTQRGYCRDICVQADVKIIGTKYVVKHVSAERLRPLITMPRDNAVCLDSWVGSTKTVNEKLTLQSTCGSILELRPDIEYCPLKDTSELKSHGGYFINSSYYPGQILVGPVSALDNAKWISTSNEMRISRKHKTVDRKFIVQSVEIEGVWVHWQCKALSNEIVNNVDEIEIQQPKCYITGDDLKRMKRLNLFESCMLQINDKNYLRIDRADVMAKKILWKKEKSNKHFKVPTHHKPRVTTSLAPTAKDNSHLNVGGDEFKITITTTTNENTTMPCDSINSVTNLECDLDNKLNNCDSYKKLESNNSIGTLTATVKKRYIENILLNSVAAQRTSDSSKLNESDDWQTEEDDEVEDFESNSESVTTHSSCSSPTPKSSPKRSPLLAKKIKKFKRRAHKTKVIDKPPAAGDDVVTEALVVYSTATVVWQDGSIEEGIPSTQLYPIHHLDDHEFFPGDFVLAGNETDVSHRDYGVIQNVDHQGRTALVKWFRTYTCLDEPRPALLGETEVSVYDLKDHPDFQYRPGTIVIRVANFFGEDAVCTAGQVIDNYPEGKVKVWWVDGHTSMCWPQDIFEVGQYDADNNFWGNGDSDNDSWETESEISEAGGSLPKSISKPHLAANLERARVAMARLEEIFSIKPNLQNQEIMKKLLAVYKKCRYLDRLMNTTFFHEDHFMVKGLLERVRKGGNATTAERVQDQMSRLFNQTPISKKSFSTIANTSASIESPNSSAILKTPVQIQKKNSDFSNSIDRTRISTPITGDHGLETTSPSKNHNTSNLSTSSDVSSIGELQTTPIYQNKLFNCVFTSIEKATQNVTSTSTDSGVSSSKILDQYNSNNDGTCSTTSNISSLGGGKSGASGSTSQIGEQLDHNDENNTKNSSYSSIQLGDEVPEFVCAKLCALIKCQLVKALQEINQRFCDSCSLSEIVVEEFDLSKEENQTEDNSAKAMDTSIEEIESVSSTPVIAPVPLDCFLILDTAPNTHKYSLTMFQPTNPQQFFKAVRREHRLLKTALPPGVWVRLFEDRMDLLSVMIEGPKNTPYEDGMFLFDIQLGTDYPHTPPMCHYVSYCSDRLNPNLYEDGKVCVSLLGTWSGRGSEVWGTNSTLLQVIVSIQGLILVAEPYFNEAGYEKQKGTQQGKENSRMYNEMVIIKLIQSMTKLILSPPEIFKEQILRHFRERGTRMYNRIQYWMELSNKYNNELKNEQLVAPALEDNAVVVVPDQEDTTQQQAILLAKILKSQPSLSPPEFPLVPASRGFCLTLAGLLDNYFKILDTISELN